MAAPVEEIDLSPDIVYRPAAAAQQEPAPANRQTRSCMLVGSGNMLIASGQLLQKAGLQVSAVVSDDFPALQWARSVNVPTIDYGADVIAWLERSPVDYLLSVINLRILPSEALQLPRIAAINFHDGPLPRYAGLHATSWAIFNDEKIHGVTWHLMARTIDTGAIVRQRTFDVAEDETALSLNLKSFKAGLGELSDMVPDLIRGTIATTPQDPLQRTYFEGWRRPAAAGLIDWSRRGEETERIARGTDFGPYFNPLVLPKLWIGGECVVAREVRLANGVDGSPPGKVLSMDDSSLTVSTASRPLAVGGLSTIDGEPLSIPETVKRHGLHVGCMLPLPLSEDVDRLTTSSEASARHERYWADRLQSLCPISLVLSPQPAGAGENKETVVQPWHVPGEVAQWLAIHGHRWQPEEFLLAAFGVFLARLGALDGFDVEFLDDDTRPRGWPSIFAEHVPFRFDIGETLNIVLDRVREERTRIAKHLTYPRDLVPRSPLLRSSAGLLAGNKLPVAVEVGRMRNESDSGHDLIMHIPTNGRDGLAVYRATHLDVMRPLMERFPSFVRNLAMAGDASLREISLVSDEERKALLDQGRSAGGAERSTDCLHHLFEAQAAETPDTVAVRCGAAELTYRELDRRADHLAGRLRRLGVRAESPVGVCLERSPEAIIGILGILKAGGAYVPLDPAYPRQRLEFIVNDSGMQTVVSMRHLAARLPSAPTSHVYLDDRESHDAGIEGFEPVAVNHRDLAYVIYTSGSTGTPKGVMVEHHAVVNFIQAARTRYTLRPGELVLQFASMNFDASVEEIFPCLSSGGTLVLRTDEMLASARIFMARCAAWKINILDLPTAYWHILVMQMREDCLCPHPELRLVIIGGEAASPAHVQAWSELVGPSITLINTYGPTEATVVSIWADLSGGEVCNPVPIGVPIPGATAYLLDRWGQPVPSGVVGHLHIGGAGLARGYLNRPRLTSERFVPDPYVSAPGGRMYRTGDLCRWRDDGSLVFHGRIDDQVKIRGHRIEPGEIEALLSEIPGIRQVAVSVYNPKPGDPRLIAYLTENGGGVADDVLRQALSSRLPDFMIPSAFVRLESLPITPTGKIDRKALPVPDLQRPSGGDPCIAPRTPLEARLAAVWCELLGVVMVGIHDDFFHSGGDSLLAMDLVAKIKRIWGVDLPLRVLFERRTIAQLASNIAGPTHAERTRTISGTALVPLKSTGTRLPFFLIHGKGGDVFHFLGLSRLLSPDQPVHGLRAVGRDGGVNRHETVEEMARHYAEEIRRLQPEGPCRIGGYSVGGWIALAVARELCNHGRQVTLVILDSFPSCRLPWPAGGVKVLLSVLGEISGLQFHARKMVAMRLHEWPGYVTSRLRFRAIGLLPKPWRRGLVAVQADSSNAPADEVFTRAVTRYSAPVTDCRVELILGLAPLVEPLFAACQIRLWQMLVQGPINVHRLPCEHMEMFCPEYLPGLAAVLDLILAE